VNFPFYESAPKESVTECNLCGSKKYALIATRDRYGLDVSLVKCSNCKLIFLSERMTPEAYREFYEKGHYRELVSQYMVVPVPFATDPDQSPYAVCLANFLAPYMVSRRGGLLLDLGGSVGIVAEKLSKEFDLDATVVEASVPEAEKARARGLSVAPVRIEDYQAGGNHYDLITLCRTVDHLLDINADLARIRGWLAPGGLFFVDFVNAERSPHAKIDHPYLLTPATMGLYLDGAGFEVKVAAHSPDGRHDAMLCEGK